jgi:ABC-type multidrug transport system fused ATPase/permease subunit
MPDASNPTPPLPRSDAPFRRLLKMLRPYRLWIGLAIVLLFLSIPCELFPAFIWQYVTDDLILKNISQPSGLAWMISFRGRLGGSMTLLFSALGWLVAIYCAGEIIGTCSTIVLQWATQKFIYILRNTVYNKLQSQSLGYLQRQRTGDLMSRVMGDVDELQSFIVNSIDTIIGDGALWLVTVGVVMWKSWRVASLSLAPLIIVFVMLRIFNRKIMPLYAAARAANGEVSTRLQENLSGIVVIKIFGREKNEAARFDAATLDYYNNQVRAIRARNIFFPLSRAVGFFSNVFMIGYGGYLILRYPHGSFTVGTLVLFRAYWYRLFGPVQTLARVNDWVQKAKAAAKRIFDVLDAPDELPDAPDAVAATNIAGRIELRDVTFQYPIEIPGRPQPAVLHDVNVRIEPGQTIALCGPSGAGKSTILNLILRFYDPASGQVLLDGRDLRSLRRDSFRSHLALVQQETFLFNDSVLDNIRYGHQNATQDQVIAAAKAANAHNFITRLPSGYSTKVGERGVRLSGGQKQRLSIARAFLANPTILLLDEPTSSVEPDSEAAIIAALHRLMTGRTTILTSHRPSLVQQADYAYVIEDGRITQQGPPTTLALEGGWFANFLRAADDEPQSPRTASPAGSTSDAPSAVSSPGDSSINRSIV